jgi:hypothetical protein
MRFIEIYEDEYDYPDNDDAKLPNYKTSEEEDE